MARERREMKGKGERERHTKPNAVFHRIESRDKKPSLNEQYKKIQENNKMGQTKYLFKKIGHVKGTFHATMDTKKDRNGKDLTEAEEVEKWQGYTEELYTEALNELNNMTMV